MGLGTRSLMRPSSGKGRTNRGLMASKKGPLEPGRSGNKAPFEIFNSTWRFDHAKGLTFGSASNIFRIYENHRAFE
jgi:hypothetical protein